MKALFVSNDASIFDSASDSRARMREYAAAIGELYIVSAAAKEAREQHEEHLHLFPVDTWQLLRVRKLAKKAKELIEQYGIGVVSAQDPFEYGLAAKRAIESLKPPFSDVLAPKLHIQVHTDFLSPWFVRGMNNLHASKVPMPWVNRFRRRWADKVLPCASGIRVVSERVKKSLVAKYGNTIVEPSVIPVRVERTMPPKAPLPKHFTYSLITVGRLEPEKRIEDIIVAVARIILKYPFLGLFIVGEGRERKRLERMVRNLGIEEHVVFTGFRADAYGLMQSAQAFIQASAYEGYGRTLVEAALAKVPIITTDVGIVGEVFTGYEDVLAAPVADPTTLSYHIVGLINDENVRLEYPRSTYKKAEAHLASAMSSPENVAADLAKALIK